MRSPDPLNDLELLLKARYGAVHLETPEHERARSLLRHLADRVALPYFRWTRTRGLRRADADASVYATQEPAAALAHVSGSSFDALYHFEDLGHHLADAAVAAALRDAAQHLANFRGAVVLTGANVELPPALRPVTATVKLPAPEAADFRELIRRIIRDVRSRRRVQVDLEPRDLDRLLDNLRGLTLMEAEKILTLAIVEDGRLSVEDIGAVAEHKRTIVEREGLLEYYPGEENMDDIADLAGLKSWLAKRRRILDEPAKAREYGLSFPKGVLLLGVPGCGKSLCAKAVAMEWGLPLLKLDPSSLYSKYVGESEQNFKRAMQTAENMAPLVLWIDELEKAFSQSSGDQDGGTSRRIFGTFLSWLQDRDGDVFVVATANDVSRLPPEFLRKGRFDEIFFVDLPVDEAREAILRIHIEKREHDPADFDLARLSRATEGFTGAEIEQIVISALYTAFAKGEPLSDEYLLAEISATRPLSETMREKIVALRSWAAERTVSAH